MGYNFIDELKETKKSIKWELYSILPGILWNTAIRNTSLQVWWMQILFRKINYGMCNKIEDDLTLFFRSHFQISLLIRQKTFTEFKAEV